MFLVTRLHESMREIPAPHHYGPNDTLVIVGELFQMGYVNGVIKEAEKAGMQIIYSTVGRRNGDGELRSLNEEELSEKRQNIINIPLEAGFDLEPSSKGDSPVLQLKSVRMNEWKDVRLDWDQINDSQQRGSARFRNSLSQFIKNIEPKIQKSGHLIFVHTMAGGIPRAKIFMPILNRVFKGRGDRYEDSKTFWDSELGRLCEKSFSEVTASTFNNLIELSSELRLKIESEGGSVRYLAYGYHGTEVYFDGAYQWQSYSPYLQGWAKIDLENYAKRAFQQGIKTTVYNCPEILTGSSSVFQGVELSLYALIKALQKEGKDKPAIHQYLKELETFMRPNFALKDLSEKVEFYLSSPLRKDWGPFETWPHHSGREQMEHQLKGSEELIEMQLDQKETITYHLSELIFKTTGTLILAESWKSSQPVWWIGHDVIAKQFASQ